MFSRARNLLRINKLYGLFRDYVEKRDKKYLTKMWDVLQDVTEFKELISLEKTRMLQGKKTYIIAGVAALVTAAKFLDFIDNDTYVAIMGFLGAGAGATIRAAMNRQEEKVNLNTLKVNSLLHATSLTGGMVNPALMQTQSKVPHTDPKKNRY